MDYLFGVAVGGGIMLLFGPSLGGYIGLLVGAGLAVLSMWYFENRA